mgnify:CR=1 FL=1
MKWVGETFPEPQFTTGYGLAEDSPFHDSTKNVPEAPFSFGFWGFRLPCRRLPSFAVRRHFAILTRLADSGTAVRNSRIPDV